MVASIVLSPSSARKNTTVTTQNALRLPSRARSRSSSVNRSPRSVQSAKITNATAATTLMGRVGSAAPTAAPMPTDTACTTAVAVVMPASTTRIGNRVAKVRAINWLLSPSSATKIKAKLIRNAETTEDMGVSR
ncbi:unannotated protein [freshwater metagenome]|uniref:Unannotated protein n=1 Tax=freshwater metagenome TaxID=449393 RepID=A0A6J6SCD3_9ZZZZ